MVLGAGKAPQNETGMKKIEDTRAMLERRARYFRRIIVVVNDRHRQIYAGAFDGTIAFGDLENIGRLVNGQA